MTHRQLRRVRCGASTSKQLTDCLIVCIDLHWLEQGLLRTREVLERLKSVPPTPGQKPAILVYLGVLLQRGKLNALESAELAR
jgi:hypothetical protein